MNKKWAVRIVGLSLVALIAYFIVKRLSTSWDELSQTTDFGVTYLSILALILFVLAVIISGSLWGAVLSEVSSEERKIPRKSEMVRVYIGAWLLKYVPGQVGGIIYKIHWGITQKFTKKEVVFSYVYEYLFLTVASVAPAAAILLLMTDQSPGTKLLLSGLLVGALALIFSKKISQKFLSLLNSKYKFTSENGVSKFDTKKILRYSSIYTLPRLINGLGFVALAISLYDVGVGDILPLVAAYTLAGIIGIYAIFVPSGIGVREAMIVLFAGSIIGVNEAIVLSLVARFYATLSDGVLSLVYFALGNVLKKEQTQ